MSDRDELTGDNRERAGQVMDRERAEIGRILQPRQSLSRGREIRTSRQMIDQERVEVGRIPQISLSWRRESSGGLEERDSRVESSVTATLVPQQSYSSREK
jgi:hypothetical protein